MSYFDTTGLAHKQPDLFAAAVTVTAAQNAQVLAILDAARAPLSPTQVYLRGPRDGNGDLLWLKQSVRRSMTVLSKGDVLEKVGLVMGPHGRPEHQWRRKS